jgi:hypothetical protein
MRSIVIILCFLTVSSSLFSQIPAMGSIPHEAESATRAFPPAADTLDKVVPEELQENAASMAVMGYALAAMTEPLAK